MVCVLFGASAEGGWADEVDSPRMRAALLFLGPLALLRDSHSWTVLLSSLHFKLLPTPFLSVRTSEETFGCFHWGSRHRGSVGLLGFSFPPKRATLSEMHQYKLLKVQSRVVTSETGGGSRDAPPPSSRRCWCVFHQVVCVCVRRKKEGELSFSGVKMGFKVTQLSGVYHVFLRTRLFLSTHFRAHVSLGRSRCKREVSGLEAPRQVSQQ